MKIVLDQADSYEFYDELLYVASRRKDLIEKPDTKVITYSAHFRKNLYLAVFGIVLMALFYLLFRSLIFIFFAGMFAILLAYVVFCLWRSAKAIEEKRQQSSSQRSVTVDEDGVLFEDENKSVHYRYDELARIIISRYSICFIPKETDKILIGLNIRYKDELKEALQAYGKEDLVQDNSGLYQ